MLVLNVNFSFLTDNDGNPTLHTHDKAGYFDLGPVDLGENARRDMVIALEEMGFEIEASHHEVPRDSMKSILNMRTPLLLLMLYLLLSWL